MILPRHAVEANIELSHISDTANDCKIQIDRALSNGNFACEADLPTYIQNLLVTVALLDGDVNELKKSALTMFGIEEVKNINMKEALTVPPQILYEAFIYQNITGNVVLPKLLEHIKTIVFYIGQLGDIDKVNRFYDELVAMYKYALEALQKHINSTK